MSIHRVAAALMVRATGGAHFKTPNEFSTHIAHRHQAAAAHQPHIHTQRLNKPNNL